ncbi:MAG: AraC family transcriptional regulator [Rhodobacter sp.]|jgi:AraC-like DNA-binding protein|nr:AraC family transcriptional regulator [Rhodobacter sp.]
MAFAAQSPFDDALADLRVSGSLLRYERYHPPWAVSIPAEDGLRAYLGVGPETRVMPFHLVLEGAFDLTVAGQPPVRIATHEVAIYTQGDPHQVSSGQAGILPAPFTAAYTGEGPGATGAGEGMATRLLCGVLVMNRAPLNPLLSALPPLLRIRTAGAPDSPMLMRAKEMLVMEVGQADSNSFTTARLIEVFCAEAIAAYRRGEGAAGPGWFRALDDQKIGRALAALHRDPAAAWTVGLLAGTVAMSPSRFAARFRETTGQSVMSCVAAWRMTVACRLLRDSGDGLAEIAQRVGYQDVAAFSRAFKALVGVSPSQWRNTPSPRASRSQ